MFFVFFLTLLTNLWAKEPSVFRLSLISEPASLLPHDQKSAGSAYLFSQMHSPLLWYQDGKLIPRLANCKYVNPKAITCEFFQNIKFSNGESITPEHYQKMINDFLDPKTPGQRADLLEPIEKTEVQNNKLKITLKKPDSDFIYNLANPILSPQFHSRSNFPTDAKKIVTSGPYVISEYDSKDKIKLKPNPFFPRKSKKPAPNLEFKFIAEDSVGLSLYQKSELDFLRRLPTLYIEKYKNNPEFYFIDQFRFDYIGLNSNLTETKRALLTENLNYIDLQNLFQAKPRPGCVGIPERLYLKKTCYEFKKANSSQAENKTYTYLFSKQGGDDHQRAAEWTQAEWKKNLGIQIELKSLENKIFLQNLQNSPPDFFRKGLAPDRPTCLSILNNFTPSGKENYLKLNDKELNIIVNKLDGELNSHKKKQLCQKGLDLIMSKKILIPTGPISFAILAKTGFSGWRLNELNVLDLSELERK